MSDCKSVSIRVPTQRVSIRNVADADRVCVYVRAGKLVGEREITAAKEAIIRFVSSSKSLIVAGELNFSMGTLSLGEKLQRTREQRVRWGLVAMLTRSGKLPEWIAVPAFAKRCQTSSSEPPPTDPASSSRMLGSRDRRTCVSEHRWHFPV